MVGGLLAEPKSFGGVGKALILLILVGLVLIWVVGVYAYSTLPERVPVHFNLWGEPDAYGDRIIFLILPSALTLGPSIILVTSLKRFSLVNKHPYLINLPAFYTRITNLPQHLRGQWINRYFEALLALGASITLFMLAIQVMIYHGAVNRGLPAIYPIAIITTPIPLTTAFILYLRKLQKEMEKESTPQS